MDVQQQLKDVQKIQGSCRSFAAILRDGSVVSWGEREFGGDSSAVQDQLKNVQQIQASNGAFAAIRADGSVVTWGKPEEGGDSSAVQELLKDVQHVPGFSRRVRRSRGRWICHNLGPSAARRATAPTSLGTR